MDRALVAGQAACFYAGKLLWPRTLAFFYEWWEVAPSVAWQWLFPLGVAMAALAAFLLRGRIGCGPGAVQQGRLEEAKEPFLRADANALFLDDRSLAMTNLASVLLRQERPNDAVVVVRQAASFEASAWTRGVLALALERAGQFAEAETVFAADGAEKPARVNPAELAMVRGEAALGHGNDAGAMRHFADYIERFASSKRDEARVEVRIALAQRGRDAAAARMFEAVSRTSDVAGRAQLNNGILYTHRCNLSPAIAALSEAVQVDPRSPDAHGNLANALWSAVQRNAALHHFEASRALAGRAFAYEADYRWALAWLQESGLDESVAPAASP